MQLRLDRGAFPWAERSSMLQHMAVQIIERAPVRVACLRHVGAYGQPVAQFWQEVAAPWIGSHGLFGRPRYGVSYDDPASTAASDCRYDACVEVPDELVPSAPAGEMVIPGGRYAVADYRGTVGQIQDAWAALLGERLPASLLRRDTRPTLEYYSTAARYDPNTGIFECQLMVPIMPC